MPRVPTYDNFQVAPNTVPQTRFQGVQPVSQPTPVRAVEIPDVAGQQAQQTGRAMQQAGGEIGRLALGMQQQANQLRVTDALNQAKEAALRATYDPEAGFTNLKGINALERPDGK